MRIRTALSAVLACFALALTGCGEDSTGNEPGQTPTNEQQAPDEGSGNDDDDSDNESDTDDDKDGNDDGEEKDGRDDHRVE